MKSVHEIQIFDDAEKLLMESFKNCSDVHRKIPFSIFAALFIDTLIGVFGTRKEYAVCYPDCKESMNKDWAGRNHIHVDLQKYIDKLKQDPFWVNLHNKCKKAAEKWEKQAKDQNDFETRLTNKIAFLKWYFRQKQNCAYCGVPREIVAEYFEKDQQTQDAKKQREGRGIMLELERIASIKNENNYTEKNCVLICYVCNNAKSNFISHRNFRPIAQGINQFWQNVLAEKEIDIPYLTDFKSIWEKVEKKLNNQK